MWVHDHKLNNLMRRKAMHRVMYIKQLMSQILFVLWIKGQGHQRIYWIDHCSIKPLSKRYYLEKFQSMTYLRKIGKKDSINEWSSRFRQIWKEILIWAHFHISGVIRSMIKLILMFSKALRRYLVRSPVSFLIRSSLVARNRARYHRYKLIMSVHIYLMKAASTKTR